MLSLFASTPYRSPLEHPAQLPSIQKEVKNFVKNQGSNFSGHLFIESIMQQKSNATQYISYETPPEISRKIYNLLKNKNFFSALSIINHSLSIYGWNHNLILQKLYCLLKLYRLTKEKKYAYDLLCWGFFFEIHYASGWGSLFCAYFIENSFSAATILEHILKQNHDPRVGIYIIQNFPIAQLNHIELSETVSLIDYSRVTLEDLEKLPFPFNFR